MFGFPARQRVFHLTGLLALLGVAGPARADVRGQVQFADSFRSFAFPLETLPESRRRFIDEWNGFVPPRAMPIDAAREVSVVLRGAGAPLPTPVVRLQNGTLLPATIAVRAGTTLQIQNDDGIRYELSAEGVAEFAATPTEPGHVRQIALATAGSFPIRDRNLAHVRGHLHVVADLVARAEVQSNGSFVFTNVPPGAYKLSVYVGEREAIAGQDVVVEDDNTEIPAVRVALANVQTGLRWAAMLQVQHQRCALSRRTRREDV